MKQIITCAIAGLGNRGNDIYGNYQFVSPEEMKVTAVAEPQEEKREAARIRYGLPENRCFSSAEEMLEEPKLADVMVIATQDRQHVEQAVNAIKKGYHVLCEKPISPNPEKEKNKVVLPLEGEVGSPINCGPGCRFASRCKYATERCKNETPVLKEIEKEHFAACHLFD